MEFVQFTHPMTCTLAGASGSGKTELVKAILQNKNEMFSPIPDKVYWYFAVWQQKLVDDLPDVNFREGMPNMNEFDGGDPSIIVIDDMMSEANSELTKLFTKGSHHKNLSIFFLVQNIFDKNKEIRTITLNSHYIVMFKNPRDKSQIVNVAKQMFPGDTKYLVEAFNDATVNPHTYLMLDFKQSTPDHLRVRTNILPHQTTTVYVSKKTSIRDQL